MQLIACQVCHTQYDVSEISAASFECRCGETLENTPPRAVDAAIERCSACGAHVTSDAESCVYCSSVIVREPRKLSLICPECFARCADDSRFCTACGVPFRPEALGAEGHELPCPVCSKLMPSQSIAGLVVNECTTCRGLWVPGEHFDQLVQRAIEARRTGASPLTAPRVTGNNPATQQVVYRNCPECDAMMNRRNFRKSSGVIVDVCRDHGTWLDSDELEAIAGFLLSGGETAASLRREESGATEKFSERRATAAYTQILAENGALPNGLEGMDRIEHASRRSQRNTGGGIVGTLLDVFITILK